MKPRLCGCTLDQLDELTNPAFDASTLDDFLAEIPESAELSRLRKLPLKASQRALTNRILQRTEPF